MPEVERWRGLVRQLIAEARADGRLNGSAAVLNEDLVLSVIEQESGGDPNAESWAGARGLMQLMPESFSWIMGIHNWGEDVSDVDPAVIRDPATNLRAGVRFLAAVLEEQGGSVYWALASYNAGGGMVNAWRAAGYASIPDWYGGGETANYAPAILGNYTAHHPAGM
jgi:soluble lytic murein transglycosylase